MQLTYLGFLEKNLGKIGGDIVGCQEQEIRCFEAGIGTKLPTAYREFLFLLGKQTGDFKEGSSMSFAYLKEMQLEALEIIKRQSNFLLKDTDFVFLVHQNYSFYFFSLTAGDDPPVHLYVDGDDIPQIETPYPAFSDYVFIQIDIHLKIIEYKAGTWNTFPTKGYPYIIER